MHPLFGTDASNFTTLQRLPVPEQLDLIIDDAAHVLSHQITSLEALWPKLAPGGVFIVEDLTVGALPWLRGEALQDQVRRAPSNNSDCKGECHYVQRPAEHPFLKRLVPSVEARKEAEAALKRGAQPQHPAPTAAAPSTYDCSPQHLWLQARSCQRPLPRSSTRTNGAGLSQALFLLRRYSPRLYCLLRG